MGRRDAAQRGISIATPVIILNWNGWEDTFACLDSLRECPDVTEVWLVDNCSEDDRLDEGKTRYPGLRCFRWDDNYGWAGGYNRALRVAMDEGYPYAFLLNNDTKPEPRFLDAAVRVMAGDATLAAVGSVLVFHDDPSWVLYDGRFYAPDVKRASEVGECTDRTDVNGAAMLLRLYAVRHAGPFDERFFCYGEETEWCWRVGAAGWRLAIAGRSHVGHKRESSDTNNNATYYRVRNQFLLARSSGMSGNQGRWAAVRSAVGIARARRAFRDSAGFASLVQGLDDALSGRFGKRTYSSRLRPVARYGVLALALLARAYEKWYVVRGLHPPHLSPPTRKPLGHGTDRG